MMYQYLLLLGLYSSLLAVLGHLTSQQVTSPYMDEIFHIPATQRYCAANFTYWDPKITTLPGLYLFSVGLLRPIHFLSGQTGDLLGNLCSVTSLRAVNLLVGLVNLVLLHSLTRAKHGLKEGYSEALGWWSSLNMSFLPTLFFFNLLHYTDPLSTSLVLLTYCLHLSERDWLASVAGLLSVVCRQSNIVWVFLAGMETGGRVLVEEIRVHQARTKQPPTISLTTWGQVRELGQGTLMLVRSPVRLALLAGQVVVTCGGYIATGLAFLAFVHINQGIVVGDKSAHMATVHLPQLFYFAAFFTFITLPFAMQNLSDFFSWSKAHPARVILILLGMMGIVHLNTLAHPYLLADNRHFTFYIWRRLVMRHWMVKYLLVPGYLFGFYHLARCLSKSSLLVKLALPLCTLLSLAPQLLLEFRYFILPCLLLRAQIRTSSKLSLALETLLLVLVNLVTIWLFLYRPFVWQHDPGEVQRFMW